MTPPSSSPLFSELSCGSCQSMYLWVRSLPNLVQLIVASLRPTRDSTYLLCEGAVPPRLKWQVILCVWNRSEKYHNLRVCQCWKNQTCPSVAVWNGWLEAWKVCPGTNWHQLLQQSNAQVLAYSALLWIANCYLHFLTANLSQPNLVNPGGGEASRVT